MPKTYFLNALHNEVVIRLNDGPKHLLTRYDALSQDPYYALGLEVDKSQDVLGTDSINRLTMSTAEERDIVSWNIQMRGIKPDQDIQFMLCENGLLARQGSSTTGFMIRFS